MKKTLIAIGTLIILAIVMAFAITKFSPPLQVQVSNTSYCDSDNDCGAGWSCQQGSCRYVCGGAGAGDPYGALCTSANNCIIYSGKLYIDGLYPDDCEWRCSSPSYCEADPQSPGLSRCVTIYNNFGKCSCGTGGQSEGEQCDDGNNVSGDGCSANCRVESSSAASSVCQGNCLFASSAPASSAPSSALSSSASSLFCPPPSERVGNECHTPLSQPSSSQASSASASSVASSVASSQQSSSRSSSRSSSSRCGPTPLIMGQFCCGAEPGTVIDFGRFTRTLDQLENDPNVWHDPNNQGMFDVRCQDYVHSGMDGNCQAFMTDIQPVMEVFAAMICPKPSGGGSSQGSGGSSTSKSGGSQSSLKSSARSSSSMRCSADADCPAGQTCEAGYCVGTQCPPTGPCECGAGGECPAGMSCSNGLCTSSSVSSNRSSNSSTSSNSFATSNSSSRSSTSSVCTSNTQCPVGQQCTSGSCTPLSSSSRSSSAFSNSSGNSSSVTTCSFFNPCPSGQSCQNGICQNLSSSRSSILSCTSNAQCPSGQQCLNGQCTNNDCTSSNQCPSGQSCINGNCTNNDCTSSNQCSSGEQCLNGNCTPPPGCQTSNDCSNGALCINGQCAPCTANNQCPGNRCINGTCSPCSSSIQCPSGLQCTNGQCRIPNTSSSAAIPTTFDGICLGNECGLGGSTFCAQQNLSCVTTAAFPCIRCEGQLAQASSVSSANPQLSCDSSLDCPSGQSCINGFCSLLSCTSNNQCATGEQCLNGRCTPTAPELACSIDADCDAGERCIQGSCLTPLELAALPAFCGNARIDLGEACDDGSLNSLLPNAACRIDCTLSRCGDSILDTPLELCDDGNTLSNDGCSATCQTERGAPNETLPAQIIELPFQAPACTRDGECASNLCINGECIACTRNDQCASGFCNAGVCSLQQTLPGAPATPSTGPAALLVMIAGAAAGYSFVRRK
jgi:cysteine-rich repeat protein/Cys-rich repeat protein